MTESASNAKRLAGFLGLKRDYLLLLMMVVLIGMGEKTGSRFVPKYIAVLGAGTLLVGLYGALEDLLGALWSLPGGYITDRLGTKKALAVFNIIAMIGYLIVVLIPAWPAVLVASIFFLSWSALSLPTVMNLVGTALPKSKRAMGVSMHSIIRRIPMGGGPVIGGALIAAYGMVTGVRITFAIAFVLAAAAMILQQKMAPNESTKYESLHLFALVRRFNPGLRRLLVSDILIRFCEKIPYSFVIFWVMDVVRKGAFEFGWLTAIEMGTAMLLYIPVAYFSDKAERKPFVLITFRFLHSVSGGAVLFPHNSAIDHGLLHSRPERIRRADPQGVDCRSGDPRGQGPHGGSILFPSRYDRGVGQYPGRRVMEDQPDLESVGGVRLRRSRDALFRPLRQRRGRNVGRQPVGLGVPTFSCSAFDTRRPCQFPCRNSQRPVYCAVGHETCRRAGAQGLGKRDTTRRMI